jgi:hypothetical protein
MYKLPLNTLPHCALGKLLFPIDWVTTQEEIDIEHEEIWVSKGDLYGAINGFPRVVKFVPRTNPPSRDAYNLLLLICESEIKPKTAQAMAQMLVNQYNQPYV